MTATAVECSNNTTRRRTRLKQPIWLEINCVDRSHWAGSLVRLQTSKDRQLGINKLGRLQLQLAMENCLGGSPTTAGNAGQCLDLQFDEGSCKVRTGFGGLRTVSCR